MEIDNYKKEYYKKNKEKINEMCKQNYIKNKDRILSQHKEYRKLNKNIIRERNNRKYDCKCGVQLSHIHKARHERSQTHLNYVASLPVL